MSRPHVFKDRVKLYITSGKGGDGAVAFRREKFVPLGGPSGGDGGNGGSVYLVGDGQADSLLDLYFHPHQKAEPGGDGATKDRHGKNGEDLLVKVPLGTVVHNAATGEWVGEVMQHEERLLIARGGQGGLGNSRFKTSTNRAPQEATPGEDAEELTLWLDLKIIADIGLVGYPNAGKSTLLCALTNAHPKVAAYPFTTLNPIMGTIAFDNFSCLRVADIPGLIDGAHEGVGLGHDFLRHIERTRFMLFVIDMGGVDGRDPTEDYRNLRAEIRLYKNSLGQVPYRILANKMDVPGSEGHLKKFTRETGETPLEICAEIGEGIEAVQQALFDFFQPVPRPSPKEASFDPVDGPAE